MADQQDVGVGVVGVGSMGEHHARVYNALPETTLVGVADEDAATAEGVADENGTRALSIEGLLDRVDAVSVAVPTRYHYEVAARCLRADVDVLVEKPFVDSLANGQDLIRLADQRDRVLQVGHVERFNPAVQALGDVLRDREIISLKAERLGPPPDRTIQDSAVLDLMVHDIDVVLAIVDEPPASITGAGVRNDRHATATLTFESDIVAEFTASRLTQKKVRKLDVVTEEALVRVDYIDKSIEIHRASTPEYIRENDDVRYRHESVVERPMVDSTEPLRNELESFLDAVRTRSEPAVTGADGIRALHVANRIELASPGRTGPSARDGPAEVRLD